MTAQQTFRNTLIVILTLVAAYALWASIRILIVLLIAIIIASAVRPTILWLRKRRIPEGLAILLVYGAILLSIILLLGAVLPPAANQFAGYLENENNLANRVIDAQSWVTTTIKQYTGSDVRLLDPEAIRTTITTVVKQIKDAVPALAGEFGGLLGDFVLVFVMGVYWLTSRDQAVDFALQLFAIGRRAEIKEIIREIETSMGGYMRGVITVSVIVGTLNFFLLQILGVPNALTLGFIVGTATAIPIVGGYLGMIAAVLLALLSSPIHAVIALAVNVAVQQLENHYLTPRLMSRSVGLNEILVIVFVFIGFSLGGVIGGLISMPIASTIMILLRHLVIEPRKGESTPQFVEGGILLPGTKDTAPKETKTTVITTETSRSTNAG
ncbi:MAG: AI-2E family transporter [Anaerolineae bacterium]|nr:AI-2E family transporter [Anaerolineae bacterium]